VTKTNYQSLIQSAKWSPVKSTFTQKIEQEWLRWIGSEDSLTSMLNEFSDNQMQVNVLSETWDTPTLYEAEKLGIARSSSAIVREVELLCNEQVMVFARSIIPQHVYDTNKATLGQLGTQPLGHLLFRNAKQRNRLRDVCVAVFTESTDTQLERNVYGRATPYAYNRGEILVQEFFINSVLIQT